MTAGPPVLGGAALPAVLLSRVRGAAAELRRRGIGPGSRVAVAPGSADDVLAWFLGADLVGAAALVLEPGWAVREREAVLDDARPDVTVGGPVGPGPDGVVGAAARGNAFYLPTTSGSSGRPKVLQRSRDSWLRSFAALGPVPGPVLIAGPLSSSLFLFGALHALWSGVPVRFRPRLTVTDAREAGTVHVVPAMLGQLADQDLGDLRTIVCGGAHLPCELRERVRGPEIVEYYGSAEHSLIALRRGGGPLRVVAGVEVEERAGELWVRSPLAFDGYLRGGALDPAPAWSGVGDRGTVAGDVVTVAGRGGAMISTGGRLVAAEAVEAALRGLPAVDDVLVAGTPHPRLGALVTAVVQSEGTPSLALLRAAAREGLLPEARPRRWLVVKALPRTASGKVARAAVVEAIANGTLDAGPLR
ncbi:hypothetical protein GCM10009836_05920 [Pseudonocardia ailaonensis]|uniref:Uncharacterized protein n=1 Tax=Pseudonocardia ailaonensis TaxID=367279 RepID=A0ABN2MKT0_9PSEU